MSASTSTTKRKKDKHRKSKPSTSKSTPQDSGKNEGADPNWAFQPPPGAKAITTNEDNGEFDWDAVKDDDDVELWLIRVPDNVKPKHLEDLSLDLSADLASASKPGKYPTSRIGALKRKHTSYDIWSLGDSNGGMNDKQAGTSHVVGGEELRSLSCLLPRKSKKGKLYLTPKPITRRLIVTAHPPEPSTSEENALSSSSMHKNPPRQKYPPELLTHRFMPYGSLVDPAYVLSRPEGDEPTSQDTLMMEADSNLPVATPDMIKETTIKKSKKKKEKAAVEAKDDWEMQVDTDLDSKMDELELGQEGKVEKEKEKKKGKKRKGEDQEKTGGSMKKSKKAKTSASG